VSEHDFDVFCGGTTVSAAFIPRRTGRTANGGGEFPTDRAIRAMAAASLDDAKAEFRAGATQNPMVPREGIIRNHRHDEPLFVLRMVA
jgi:hypothetical protein